MSEPAALEDAPSAERNIRIEASLSPYQKGLLEQAADIEGRSLEDFLVFAAQAEAARIVESHNVIRLSRKDQERFVESLLNPGEPNEALKEAWRLHQQIIQDE